MITSLLVALIYIAILCLVGWGVLQILGSMGMNLPAPVIIVFKVLIAVLCLLVLLQVLVGGVGLNWPYLHR